MELELKHIAPYLPYGLNIVNTVGKNIQLTAMDFPYHFNKGFKPILRPLTDLYKEIDSDNVLHYPYSTLRIPLDLAMNMDHKNINNFPYKVIMQIIEWHFDIFNLIPNGLAIDINTLD